MFATLPHNATHYYYYYNLIAFKIHMYKTLNRKLKKNQQKNTTHNYPPSTNNIIM